MALCFLLFWVILNGRLDADVLIIGVPITALMLAAVCAWSGWSFKKELFVYRLIPRGTMYFFALLLEIIKANIAVIRIIFYHDALAPCVRTYQTALKTSAGRAMLANSITLTPGTVTVQLNGDVLTVNCLNAELAEGLSGWTLEKRLIKMEQSILGAGERNDVD